MIRLLALDQSPLSTGFALWDEGREAPISGAWPLCEGIAKRAVGFVQVHRSIAAIHKERPIDVLVYEQPIKRPSDKVEKLIALYGVAAHIESYCQIKGIRCFVVRAGDWRETYLGAKHGIKGSENFKRAAVERGRQFGFDPVTHDEAEAIGILDHQLHAMKITPPWRLAHPFTTMI